MKSSNVWENSGSQTCTEIEIGIFFTRLVSNHSDLLVFPIFFLLDAPAISFQYTALLHLMQYSFIFPPFNQHVSTVCRKSL